MVVFGPIYGQAGLTLGVDFPTENARFCKSSSEPDATESESVRTRGDVGSPGRAIADSSLECTMAHRFFLLIHI